MVKYQIVQSAHAQNVPKDILGWDQNKMATSDLGTVLATIINVINVAIYLAALVASIMILEAAFQYITSYGDDTKAASAKKTLIWSIVGLTIIAVTKIVVVGITKTLGSALGGP